MINIRMQNKDVQKLTPKITVIGVGGAGGNGVNNMISAGLQGADFIVCNSDSQALEGSLCQTRIQLGATVTGGLGAGARPEVGRNAAEESLDDVMQHLEGANMVFITAGMGGGTGTGAAPVIARACRERGILTVGVVTKPFHFEGTLRMKMAEAGIQEMQEYVDTLIVIPNQNLFRIANERTTFAEAFRLADSVLQSGVRGVTDLMIMPGLINLDFADIRSAMLEMGKAMMGTGEATGEHRAIEASEKAINNPLLDDVSMKGARGVIINVTGGYDMTLFEVDEACNRIRDEVDPNANIIFGSTFDESLEGIMRVSVVATGIDVAEQKGRGKTTTSSGQAINSLTAQERRFERVQPNTDVAASSSHADTSPYGLGAAPVTARASSLPVAAPTITRPAAPVYAAPQTTGALAHKVEEQMLVSEYVQQELMIEADRVVSPAVVPPQAETAQSVRGEVYNNAFIPPRPIEPEQPRERDMMAAPYATAQSLAASRTFAEQPSAGYNLKPPVPGAHAQQKKRTPSLFERFTNPLRHHHADEADERGESEGTASSGGPAPAFHTRQGLSQGNLNIDAPKAGDIDDELDIPAFLRRQAN